MERFKLMRCNQFGETRCKSELFKKWPFSLLISGPFQNQLFLNGVRLLNGEAEEQETPISKLRENRRHRLTSYPVHLPVSSVQTITMTFDH